MNIIIAAYSNLNCNSGLHVFHLANKLVERGHVCVVFVPEGKSLTLNNGESKFITKDFKDIDSIEPLFSDQAEPDLIHVWTPREIVRRFVVDVLLKKFKCPYVVHLEDNEEHIFNNNYSTTVSTNIETDVPLHLSHPVRAKQFIENSSGMTVLIEKLLEFKPEGLLGQVFWPGYDSAFGDLKIKKGLKKKLGIKKENKVIVYMGNAHSSNRDEIFSLYLAVYILNRSGVPVTLIRTGKNHVPIISDDLPELKDNCIELGFLPRDELPGLLSIADFFVQPGTSNNFNDFRFPSKLPDFLVSGKPVILPHTNIGRSMKNGVNCLLLERGDAIDIAQHIEWLIERKGVAAQIGIQGREFAMCNLTWDSAAKAVEEFYKKIGGGI
jgi:glycosyltransferase involved in cell wall biosynthesis